MKEVINEVYEETGYDLVDHTATLAKFAGMKKTVREWDMVFHQLKLDPLKVHVAPEILPTCVVPKFAASMALLLRSRLGRLQNNQANALLAEREYLRLARGLRVRDVDIIGHQQHVLNAVFGEKLLDHIGSTRSRIPRWMRWAHSVETPGAAPLAC